MDNKSPMSGDEDNIFSKKVTKNNSLDNMDNTFDLDGLGVDAEYEVMPTNEKDDIDTGGILEGAGFKNMGETVHNNNNVNQNNDELRQGNNLSLLNLNDEDIS